MPKATPGANCNKESNIIGWMTLYFGIVVLYATIAGYAAVVAYKAGYLRYFNVDIRSLDYRPVLADYINQPAVSVFFTLTILGLIPVLLVLLNFIVSTIHSWVSRKGKVNFAYFTEGRIFPGWMIVAIVAACAVAMLLKVAIVESDAKGHEVASSQRSFTAIKASEPSGGVKVLIHQADGLGVFKYYDVAEREFGDRYELLSVSGQSFEMVNLDDLNPVEVTNY